MRLFISYSRQDAEFARHLAKNLSDLGADIWIDVDDIPAGMNWSTAIQQGLNTCDVLLLIISPDSMASPNVENEWQYFYDKHKPVLPLLLRATEVHFQIKRLQHIDFETQSFETAFQKLLDQLTPYDTQLGTNNDVSNIPESTHKPVPKSSETLWYRDPRFVLPLVVTLLAAFIGIFPSIMQQFRDSDATHIALARITDAPTGTSTETHTPSYTPSITSIPTDTPPPTNTLSVTLTFTPTQTPVTRAYPCEATVILRGSDASTIRGQVYSQARSNSTPLSVTLQVGQTLVIRQSQMNSGARWYQIGNEQGGLIGWITEQYLSLSETCPT